MCADPTRLLRAQETCAYEWVLGRVMKNRVCCLARWILVRRHDSDIFKLTLPVTDVDAWAAHLRLTFLCLFSNRLRRWGVIGTSYNYYTCADGTLVTVTASVIQCSPNVSILWRNIDTRHVRTHINPNHAHGHVSTVPNLGVTAPSGEESERAQPD